MSIYTDLGIRPVINAAGAVTRYGGSIMAPAVVEAEHPDLYRALTGHPAGTWVGAHPRGGGGGLAGRRTAHCGRPPFGARQRGDQSAYVTAWPGSSSGPLLPGCVVGRKIKNAHTTADRDRNGYFTVLPVSVPISIRCSK